MWDKFAALFLLVEESKAIHITGCGGLQGCDITRVPHSLDSLLTDGSEIVRLTRRLRSTLQKHHFSVSSTDFC
jgi:hypothetical protein